jgi:hypothetical protein
MYGSAAVVCSESFKRNLTIFLIEECYYTFAGLTKIYAQVWGFGGESW